MDNYKSKEERQFSYYLDELLENNLIEKYEYENQTFELTPEESYHYIKKTQLKTKLKEEKKKQIIFRKMTYTPDFVVHFSPRAAGFANKFDRFPLFVTSGSSLICYIDVKASFGKKASDIRFPDRQKMMYFRHRIYVQKIVPTELFEDTFTPKKVLEEEVYTTTRNGKWKIGDSKLKYIPKTIKEWLR